MGRSGLPLGEVSIVGTSYPLLYLYGSKMEPSRGGVLVGDAGTDAGGAECQPGPRPERGLGAPLDVLWILFSGLHLMPE